MIVEFSTVATATLTEYWRAENVPNGLTGDALTDWLQDAISAGSRVELEFLCQEVEDERDRELSRDEDFPVIIDQVEEHG